MYINHVGAGDSFVTFSHSHQFCYVLLACYLYKYIWITVYMCVRYIYI